MPQSLYILVKDENNQFRKPKKLEENLSTEWSIALAKHRRIALTQLNNDITVSTVFLGVDHNYNDHGPPMLFETMVFTEKGCGNSIDDITRRYDSWEEAEKGHHEIVRLLKLKAFW